MMDSARGCVKFYRGWQRQDGMCANCQESIKYGSTWVVRHMLKKTNGGTDAARNLEINHLKCNRKQLYAEKDDIFFVKPGA
jgi:RNA-directed DNA polymerase